MPRSPRAFGCTGAAGLSGTSGSIQRVSFTAQALWLPLHTYAATYGLTRSLNFRPFADELPRFYLASWK